VTEAYSDGETGSPFPGHRVAYANLAADAASLLETDTLLAGESEDLRRCSDPIGVYGQ
jgi:hypothetical protein